MSLTNPDPVESNMNNNTAQNLERFHLIQEKEECLQTKELLKDQYSTIMEELIRARDREDYTTLQKDLARMSQIGADIQVLNWKIDNIDHQLDEVPEK
jgi:hypothetical protein